MIILKMHQKMMEKSTMKYIRIFVVATMVFMTISAQGQCKFCKSYEDFIDDHWEKLDTVYCKKIVEIRNSGGKVTTIS